jgi:UDP-N-acetyl-D-mannosaminuronic acid transferase (WecB/TagA/CpsF family)
MVERLGEINATALAAVRAAFDRHAGASTSHSGLDASAGLERLFRLTTEPHRLARRYPIDNSIFIFKMFQHIIGIRAFERDW